MSQENFQALVAAITADIAGKKLDEELMDYLNERFSPASGEFQALARACEDGVREGWLAEREAGGIRYGRVIKAGPETHGFSVDVVEMDNVKGPHHRHPNGEVDMIVPQGGEAEFDGHGEGWVVYPPDSAHHPTVAGGKAIVLYLLPEGAIEFTRG